MSETKVLKTSDGAEAKPGQVVYARGQFGVVRCIVADDPFFTKGSAIECGVIGHDVCMCFKDRDNWAEKYPVESMEHKLREQRNSLIKIVMKAEFVHQTTPDDLDAWKALGESAHNAIGETLK
jgi:hypothetical protein